MLLELIMYINFEILKYIIFFGRRRKKQRKEKLNRK